MTTSDPKTLLERLGLTAQTLHRNLCPAKLYEHALLEKGTRRPCALSSEGALIAYSGAKTGRSPLDRRIVEKSGETDDVDWGKINIPFPEASFDKNLAIAKKFLSSRETLYVVDAFAGWRPDIRIKVRVVCARPYHALFMHDMLIRPTEAELQSFGEPDWTIFNAGQSPADPTVEGVGTATSIAIDLGRKSIVILGTEYAGCMKKGVFSVLNYLLPKKGILSMHCSANEGPTGDTALYFGLSGTGKTTLSADPDRALIGDDEHGWDDKGIFNIEGGCYAKTAGLSRKQEPEIWDAIRFGSVLENVVYDPQTHRVDYDDVSITENTRVAYPLESIKGSKIPALGSHPKNIFFLTCDAYSVLPPISLLSPEQAMYHFMSGYSAKVAGTEMGVKEPVATFSACFGAAFMIQHPRRYAELLREKMKRHKANVWLVNTGWAGGGVGQGKRMSLVHTRSLIRAALAGELDSVSYAQDPIFGLRIPSSCPNVPTEMLSPRNTWVDKAAYDHAALKLAKLFRDNFAQFRDPASEELQKAGPLV